MNDDLELINAIREKESIEIIQSILERKECDINYSIRDDYWYNALDYAFISLDSYLETLQNTVVFEKTELYQEAIDKEIEIIKLLIEQDGIDLDSQNSKGINALMYATDRNLTNIVKIILEKGGLPNLQDSGGDTALMRATRNENVDIVKLLLINGADPQIKDAQGLTAPEMTKSREVLEVFGLGGSARTCCVTM